MERSENYQGSMYMVIAMAAFAMEDMFIKAAAAEVSLGLVITLFGLGGTLVFYALLRYRAEPLWSPQLMGRTMMVRTFCEIIGRGFFALAITLTPLSSASAILQSTPLIVVLGGSLFLKEKVRLRQWIAIVIGFSGVLMIVWPGLMTLNMVSLLAVVSTFGFAGRDLATRAASPHLSNAQLGFYGFLVLIITGLCLSLASDKAPVLGLHAFLQIAAAVFFGVIAYNALTLAMRLGEISVVAPFRYFRVVFAMLLGFVVFGEQPDLLTLLGTLIIVASGIAILAPQGRR